MLTLKVTDINQYVYCPRIPYFTYVQPLKPRPTPKMDFGKEAHTRLDKLEKRRTLAAYPELEAGERKFHTYIHSARLGLEGKLDLHLVHRGEIFPVEFKSTSRRPGLNHKYQLTAYAMLLEEQYRKPVRRGYFKLVNPLADGARPEKSEITLPVEITVPMRDFVKDVLRRIRAMVTQESLPSPKRPGNRCRDCEYRIYCLDLGDLAR
ncbi:CRISPR-associated protein Cas4 [Heliobacterium gestii]|uniref:CRISPR-associated exonuclease Cas4 n=1 Tax=Heliomicrobium gestii TaxID=2699 RepID=A0A845LFN5_HELGE|nr:CRISPR-associated protein Cas4 [Heliomicrobium gestii]MBM7865397.1 CRISPR-associated exonuclease Cas4 [Heliomicrobium gestii]MZP41656.1 CRISPR-associated protein Cas4 [Heliomicrobium gestii]